MSSDFTFTPQQAHAHTHTPISALNKSVKSVITTLINTRIVGENAKVGRVQVAPTNLIQSGFYYLLDKFAGFQAEKWGSGQVSQDSENKAAHQMHPEKQIRVRFLNSADRIPAICTKLSKAPSLSPTSTLVGVYLEMQSLKTLISLR